MSQDDDQQGPLTAILAVLACLGTGFYVVLLLGSDPGFLSAHFKPHEQGTPAIITVISVVGAILAFFLAIIAQNTARSE